MQGVAWLLSLVVIGINMFFVIEYVVGCPPPLLFLYLVEFEPPQRCLGLQKACPVFHFILVSFSVFVVVFFSFFCFFFFFFGGGGDFWIDYEPSLIFLRDSKASEQRARTKIFSREETRRASLRASRRVAGSNFRARARCSLALLNN